MFSYKVRDTLPLTGNTDTIYLVRNVEAGTYDEYVFYSDNEPALIGSCAPGEEQEIEDMPHAARCKNCAAPVRPGQKCEYCGALHMTYVVRKNQNDILYL